MPEVIAVDWRPYAAAGISRAEERRLRADCLEAVDQDYRHAVMERVRTILSEFARPYREAVVAALNAGGVPEADHEIRKQIRDLDAEIAAVPRPRISVTAEMLDKRERDLYKGRALRKRMKLVQTCLDDTARMVRYQGVLLALGALKKDLSRRGGALAQNAAAAQPLIQRAEGMKLTLRGAQRVSTDPHVVPVLRDEVAAARLRDALAGDLFALKPFELLKHAGAIDDAAIAQQIEHRSPADLLGDLAARLAGRLAEAARGISVGDFILQSYEDGVERLRRAVSEAVRTANQVGSYKHERNGQAVRRLIFTAHWGSEAVEQIIEEVLRDEGCLADRSERPTVTNSSAIHFLALEAGVSPACLLPACGGGSWHQRWIDQQRAFDSGQALNPAARDSVVLKAVRKHKTIERLNPAFVEEAPAGRRAGKRQSRAHLTQLRRGEEETAI
jgi:hypothetical protein